MSADDDGDSGPGRREVAARLFAAEFEDATVSYRESDEERAPNYVVLPTGARVNRAFAAGVLTEVDPVNEEVVRARIADPTGAFVSYAGQYQPEALAFFERADPPAFVAITGKARTFEPEDGDRVFSSLRPEAVNSVDAGVRDRWAVDAARATLRRVATTADALSRETRGDALRAELAAEGVPEALAAGVSLAIERYGVTETYLEDVRRTAVEALEVVAGDRDTVSELTTAPDEGGPATLGPLSESAASGDRSAADEADAVESTESVEADAVESGTTDSGPTEADAGEPVEPDTDEPIASDIETEASDLVETETDEPAGTGAGDDVGDFNAGDGFDDDLYEMDEDERREAAELGTEFSTGTEVDPAGEADIDVPDEPPVPTDEAADGEADADAADDVDLEDAVVETMQALDDGDGADREAVVARVAEEQGAAPDAVEEAVQDALMSGRCYEPDETTLKPI